MKYSLAFLMGVIMPAALFTAEPGYCEEEAVTLDDIQVTGMSQELGMRAIKMALDTPRSSRAEDQDKLVCWFDKSIGSHMTQLYCATNRVLEEAGDFSAAALGGPATAASSGALKKIRSWRVNRGEFEAALEALGPSRLNEEIVARAMQGEPVPENVPVEAELNQFTNAMTSVRKIAGEYDPRIAEAGDQERRELIAQSDRLMAEAIVEAGLSVDRYNEISELVSRYTTLRDYVRERLTDSR